MNLAMILFKSALSLNFDIVHWIKRKRFSPFILGPFLLLAKKYKAERRWKANKLRRNLRRNPIKIILVYTLPCYCSQKEEPIMLNLVRSTKVTCDVCSLALKICWRFLCRKFFKSFSSKDKKLLHFHGKLRGDCQPQIKKVMRH